MVGAPGHCQNFHAASALVSLSILYVHIDAYNLAQSQAWSKDSCYKLLVMCAKAVVPVPCLCQQCLAGDVSGTKAPNCPAAVSATAKPIIPRLHRNAGLATQWSK